MSGPPTRIAVASGPLGGRVFFEGPDRWRDIGR